MGVQWLAERVRRPEYTGTDRCWPCTGVNLVIVVAGGALAGGVTWRAVGPLPGALAMAVVLLAGIALIALRGYVIPYTPRIAPRIVGALGLEHLFHQPLTPEAGALRETDPGEAPDGEALLSVLVDSGVVEVSDDQVHLAGTISDRWRTEMKALAKLETPALAEAVEAVADAAAVRPVVDARGDWIVLSDGREGLAGETWLPRPVAIAEAGAMRALKHRLPDAQTRRAAVGTLRMFLEACPDCGAPLEETTTAACCGGITDPRTEPDDVLACPDCDVRLFVFEEA